MIKETGTKIEDPAEAIRAAFDLFECILTEGDLPREYNGATFTPVMIERVSHEKKDSILGFEVKQRKTRRKKAPDEQRVLLEA